MRLSEHPNPGMMPDKRLSVKQSFFFLLLVHPVPYHFFRLQNPRQYSLSLRRRKTKREVPPEKPPKSYRPTICQHSAEGSRHLQIKRIFPQVLVEWGDSRNIIEKMNSLIISQIPTIDLMDENLKPGQWWSQEAIQKYANIMWPTGYHNFCETINLYAKLLVEIDQISRRLLFDAYGLDKRHCDSLIESTNYMLRSFKYLVPENSEDDLGLYAHTDASYFTILQQNNVAGLQVKLKSGEWIDVDPSPCLFLVGAGDALKVWSNDRILACEHKVVVKEKKKRCSMGLFSFNKSMLQTQEELVDEDHPKRYKSVNHYEYLIFREKFPSQVFSFLQV
ncbi:hypothetical protein K1719_021525 [Acacia pycnantha]|nr:hypothetical protein K1719_021525 [Acacia pycnantha]